MSMDIRIHNRPPSTIRAPPAPNSKSTCFNAYMLITPSCLLSTCFHISVLLLACSTCNLPAPFPYPGRYGPSWGVRILFGFLVSWLSLIPLINVHIAVVLVVLFISPLLFSRRACPSECRLPTRTSTSLYVICPRLPRIRLAITR